MSTDDKFGIASGLMALGLAAGIILLAQLTYNKDYEEAAAKAALATTNSGKDAKIAPASDNTAEPVTMKQRLYAIFPHREIVVPEAIFDGIVCLLALPAGIVIFYLGIIGGANDPDDSGADSELATSQRF